MIEVMMVLMIPMILQVMLIPMMIEMIPTTARRRVLV